MIHIRGALARAERLECDRLVLPALYLLLCRLLLLRRFMLPFTPLELMLLAHVPPSKLGLPAPSHRRLPIVA